MMQQDDLDAAVKPDDAEPARRPRYVPIRVTLDPGQAFDPSKPGATPAWAIKVTHAETGEIIPVSQFSLSLADMTDSAILATITVPVFALDVAITAHVAEDTGSVIQVETAPAIGGEIIRLSDRDRFRLEEVYPCSACGSVHPILFTRLDNPETFSGIEWTHAGACPRAARMVYMLDWGSGNIGNGMPRA
jgi:hypothetical protein